MTEAEFIEWADDHCTVLGLNFADDRSTVGAWFGPFSRSNYAEAELKACTEAMTALVSPIRLCDQLAWINDFIRRSRHRIAIGRRRQPVPEVGYDPTWFRSEVEKLFPSQRWTNADGKKQKRTKAHA